MQDKELTCRPVDYAIGKTKEGKPQLIINCELEEEGQTFTENWYGTFKEGRGREITLETLYNVFGMATDDVAALAQGRSSGLLDLERDFTCVYGPSTFNGKTTNRIKFINLRGGAAFSQKLEQTEAASMFNGMNVKGDAMRIKQQAQKNAPIPNHAPQSASDSSDPF